MENVLEYKGVTKKYGAKVALDNIDLALPKGSIVGLLGPNGSGKTTMLKLAAGLLTKNRGEISVCGLKPGAEAKNLIAYQPDKIYINDWMTLNNLMKMMEDFYTNFNRTKALDMIERLGLNPKERIKSMSKGNKEKVQLIITMSRDVPLYLLDEPIGGVDPAARDYILNTIEELQNKEFTSFEINYIKEVKAYSQVQIGYIRENNIYKIKGFVDDELCFSAIIKIK